MNPREPLVWVTTFAAASLAGGQDTPGASTPPATSEVRGEPARPRERLISPRVAALLAAARPKYETAPATPADAGNESGSGRNPGSTNEASADGIVRLPNYIVRQSKLPTPLEVNPRELERQAMERYLGPENGFDRGFLNLFTSKQIPLLRLIGSVSNEARAMARYREDERLRMKADLLELATLSKRAGDAAGAAKLKRETENAFRHD